MDSGGCSSYLDYICDAVRQVFPIPGLGRSLACHFSFVKIWTEEVPIFSVGWLIADDVVF